MHTFADIYIPGLEKYWLPIRVADGEEEVLEQFPMLPLHEIFAMLAERDDDCFATSCFGPEGLESCADFWAHVGSQAWCSNHPAVQHPDRLPFTVPAAMFGDDCRIFKHEKITVWEFAFILSPAAALTTRFVIAILPEWLKSGDSTYRDIEAAITWSWKAALDGKWPTVSCVNYGLPHRPAPTRARDDNRFDHAPSNCPSRLPGAN